MKQYFSSNFSESVCEKCAYEYLIVFAAFVGE